MKAAVAHSKTVDVTNAYKLIATRLTECSFAYGLLAENASNDEKTRSAFADARDIYGLVGPFLHSGNPEDFKQVVSEAQTDLLLIRKSEDKKKMFYLLRNCADFSKSQSDVVNAIAELGM